MSIRRQTRLSAAPVPAISTTSIVDSGRIVTDAMAAYRAAVVESLRQAMETDAAMWSFDTRLTYRWQANAVCQPRSEAARSWRSDGPCGLDRIDCNWGMWVLDEQCNRRVFVEHMFQFPRYVWAQSKLGHLLGPGRPAGYPTASNAAVWASWVFEVLRFVSVAYWSTNVRANGAGHMGPDRFDTTPYLNTRGVAWENFEVRARLALGTRYPEAAWRSTLLPGAVDVRLWNYLRDSGWSRGADGRAVLTPPRLPRSKSDFDPSVLVAATATSNVWPEGLGRPRFDATPLAVLTTYFQETARVAERQWWYRTRQLFGPRRTMQDVYWPTAELVVAQTEAMARDVVDRSMGTLLAEGLQRWNDAISQLPGDYRNALFGSLDQYRDFSRAITNANMDMMLGGIQAGTAIVGAIASAVNAGAGAIIAIYSALLQGMHEILKATDSYATGSGAIPPCPPIPMVRTMAQSQCNFELIGSDGATFTVRPEAPLTIPSPDPPPVVAPSASGGGALIAGGAFALLALLSLARK